MGAALLKRRSASKNLVVRAMFVFSVCCLVSRQCHKISPIVSSSDSSVLASNIVTLSPSVLSSLTRLKSLQGGADAPLACKILCVRFTPVVHVCYSFPTIGNAVRQGRNTRYGWVVSPCERSSRSLSRPGLSPGKKHQASLGALRIRSARELVSRASAAVEFSVARFLRAAMSPG